MRASSTVPDAVDRFWSPAFIIGVALALLGKLWLVADDKRIPLGAPYDDLNFVGHARAILDGKWLGDYNNLTLIKGPFYSIFIAVASDTGVPLRIAETLLHALACIVVIGALVPVVRRTDVRVGTFLLLFFDPMTFDGTTARVIRGDIIESLTLLVLGLTVWLFLRSERPAVQLIPASAALGLALAAFLMTREEGAWIYAFLLPLALAYLAGASRPSRAALAERGIPIAVAAGVALTSYAAVAATNLAHYGWFTTVETTSPEFAAAYGALARLVPPGKGAASVDPRVPIRLSALEPAYRVSPAARELRPVLDGFPGRTAARASCDQLGICGGITGGWFLWVFRDGVATAGHYSSGSESRRYYVKLAAEIDGACAEQKLRCTANRHTLAPPVPLAAAPRILGDALGAASALVAFRYLSFADPPVAPSADVATIFRTVTGDRLSVDAVNPADHDLKRHLQRAIGVMYQTAVPWLFALATLILLGRLRSALLMRRFDPIAVITLCVVAASATLLVLLAVVEDFSFHVLGPEYMKPLYATALFYVAFTLTADAQTFFRLAPRFEAPVSLSRRAVSSLAVGALALVGWLAFAATKTDAVAPIAQSAAATAAQLPKQPLRPAQLKALARLEPAESASIDGALLENGSAWSVQNLEALAVKKGATLKLVGWAADPKARKPSRGLLLIVDRVQRFDVTASYGGDRADLAAAFKDPAMAKSGFSALLPTSSLSLGKHIVTLGIVSADEKGYYPSKSASFIVM